MFAKAVRQSSLCFTYVDSCIVCRLYIEQMTLTEKHVKWSVTLADRFGPEIVTVFEIKGQVLHRVRLHVKVPGLVVRLKCTPK